MNRAIDYQDIFDFTSNGLLVTDAGGSITHFNPKAAMVLGLKHRHHLGKMVSVVLPAASEPLELCLGSGKDVSGFMITGQTPQLLLNITPILKEGGVLGAVCAFQEMREIESSAENTDTYKSLNRQLETIFYSSSDGIWVCDGKGTIININTASERLNGISAAEVVGKNINDLLENREFDQSVTARIIASGRQETIMQYISRTNRFLLSTGTPAMDENGQIALIVINERDITELNLLRKQFEESRKAQEKFKEELSELTLLELQRKSIIAESSRMRQVMQMSLKLSHLGATNILILGESGTGKGLLARMIHKNSGRRKKPFVEINCAALPEQLLEAELFGYEKGAFTGAGEKGKIGLFELAQGGTLFLDEIGDMPLALQSKLLKYLDNNEIRRVGGTESIKISCSTIAATNHNLKSLVQQKRFREDLYYRLSSFILELPPLRERVEDISGLIRFYLSEFNQKYSCNRTIGAQAIRRLQKYRFPGNIRELKNIIENGVVMSETNHIDEFVQSSISDGKGPEMSCGQQPDSIRNSNLSDQLHELEKQILKKARMTHPTTREMAVALGISQPSVVRKLKRYNIR